LPLSPAMRWMRRLLGSAERAEASVARVVDATPLASSERAEAPSDLAASPEPSIVVDPAAPAEPAGDVDAAPVREAGDTVHPVDLTGGLDAGLEPGRPRELSELADEVLALALRAERDERPLLAELARRLRRNDLRLPPMPRAVVRVQRLLDSAQCSVGDIVREIELDPALATRLVGIANSPFYQGLGAVQSLGDAIVRIGLGETRNIVLAVMLRSRVFRVPGHEREIEQLWAHSVATSICAQTLGACLNEDPDIAFLTGLLHDLGRVVLLSLAGEAERASKGRARIAAADVRRMDRLLHPALGATVGAAWRIGPPILAAIAHHHTPATAPPEHARMAWIAHAADLLAHRIQPISSRRALGETAWEAALAGLGIDRALGGELQQEAVEAIETRGKRL